MSLPVRHRLLLLFAVGSLAACAADPGVASKGADTAVSSPETGASSPVETTDSTNGTSNPPATDDTTTTGSTTDPAAMGDGVGDSLFPDLGNPGLDVTHYDIDLSYDHGTGAVEGSVGMDVTLTQDRHEITLDSSGPEVTAVTIDGTTATFVPDDPELRITLPTVGRAGDELRVEVQYHVQPTPSYSETGLPTGWYNTPDGSYVLNEPEGARTWLPCNDHPSDKASYTFTITVPTGVTAVANGAMSSTRTEGTHDVWVWQEDRPMATYLIQLETGAYDIIDGVGPHGLPMLSVVLHDDRATMQPFIEVTPKMIEFFEPYFGTYPLDRYGIAVTDSSSGLAMETQERSLFSRDDLSSGELGNIENLLLSHELAHQWFGDAVSPARWQDVWLNESFATYGEWMWMEHAGYGTVSQSALRALAQREPGSSVDPTVEGMFGANSYEGGAVVLHALRLTIGDDAFFEVLTQWAADNNGTSRTTEDFVAFAEKISGVPLADFFDTWLYADNPPSHFPKGA